VVDTVQPYLGNRILEVGAGIGNTSRSLPVRDLLVLSEADKHLADILQQTVSSNFPQNAPVKAHWVDLDSNWTEPLGEYNFDTIISFNVVEHVQNDLELFRQFARILKLGKTDGPKRIVTFVPAHNWAYGSLDRIHGHCRRYSEDHFRRIVKQLDPSASLYTRYFNLFGLPNWFLMSRVLGRTTIGEGPIQVFEKVCPWVRPIDDFLHHVLRLPFGQSIIAVITI
tara:strand:- start:7165 stop:7839 length:675 start_codon:yes stop_codon:yes gene_type:complete